MHSIKDITEPVKIYQQAKETNHQNALDFFDELIKKTETNLDANKAKCEEYYKKVSELEDSNKLLKKLNSKKGFHTFLMVISFIFIITIPFGIMAKNKINNTIKPQINDMSNTINKLNEEAETLKNEAYKIAAKLNASYDFSDSKNVFSETVPLVQFDKYFDNKRFAMLNDRYGFNDHDSDDVSTVSVLSGSILGNPFVLEKNLCQEMFPHLYTGSLVITWTTTSTDSQGRVHTQVHTQTLIANITRPAPEYFYETWLIYGNEAAPKLHYSRSPSGANSMSEKQINKMSKRYDKKLEKLSKKDITFTKMSNSEFETLYNAINRDEEVEFRLLFTPLAQRNMVDLIKMKVPFGDDFKMIKDGKLNYVSTAHSQTFNFDFNPSGFVNFDIEKSKDMFIDYCDQFFENFYFELAPLLCIPLYGNYKAKEYIYKDNHRGSYTTFEAESHANMFDREIFKPKGCATDLILKAKFLSKSKDVDIYSITAYGFEAVPHVELVPTLGGDGFMHPVPVHWFEYLKISKDSSISLKDTKQNRYEFIANLSEGNNNGNINYQKGLISAIINTK